MTTVAAILVGGKGTRLRPLVADVPKPLANVAGEPFLFILLRELAALGIQKVILLTGYLHDKMVEACGDGSQFNLSIQYSRELEPLGTGGALANAHALLKDHAEFVLLNGDTYITCSLRDFFQQMLKPTSIGAIGVIQPDDAKRYGTVALDPTTRDIIAFREKDEKTTTGLVSAGIYKLSSDIFNYIPEGQASSLEQDIFPFLIAKGHALQSFFLNGMLCDIGLPESYVGFMFDRIVNSPDLNLDSRTFLTNLFANLKQELVL